MVRPKTIEEALELRKRAAAIGEGLRLTWRCDRAGDDHLDVAYEVRHGGSAELYLLDRVIVFAQGQGFELAPDAVIALDDAESPGTLSLSRGYVSPPLSNVMHELVPGARPLAPGVTAEGRAHLPLPLRGWHPNEGVVPLGTPPTLLRLRVGLLPAFCDLDELELTDGSRERVPSHADAYSYQQWLLGEVIEVPGGTGPITG